MDGHRSLDILDRDNSEDSPDFETNSPDLDDELPDLDKIVRTCWDEAFDNEILLESVNPIRMKRHFEELVLTEAKKLKSQDEILVLYSKVIQQWSDKVVEQLVKNSELQKNLTATILDRMTTCNESIKIQLEEFFFTDLIWLFSDTWCGTNYTLERDLTLKKWSWSQSPQTGFVSVMILIGRFLDDRCASRLAKKYGIRPNCFFKVKILFFKTNFNNLYQ